MAAADLLRAGFEAEQRGELEAAAGLYRQALAAQPRMLEAHVNLAGLAWRLEDFEATLAHAQEALAIAPTHAYAQRIAGTAYLNLNRVAEAEQHLRRALQLQPDYPAARLDLAFTLLLAGRLEEGWQWFAQRWGEGGLPRPEFYRPAREWPGPAVPLEGEAIAVYGEQGRGDVLQFLRYIPRLQALGARVFAVVRPELAPLVEASFPGVACWAPGRPLQVQWHAALMDLPLRFGTTLQDMPAQVPYLRPPAAARARWADRMAPWQDRFKVGIAWSGAAGQANNRNRAVPLSLLLPLARLPGVQCFSLQKADAGGWTDVQPADGEIVDFSAEWEDFGDSAAFIERLDLVVSVDTAPAHLAGALGKPTWILLGPNADWRWLLRREDSPWYPTARLFRRGLGEARPEQAARMLAALRAQLP
jgi:hypothetical protein